MKKAPDDILSRIEPISEVRIVCNTVSACSRLLSQFLQVDYTLDVLNKHDFYHEGIVRSKLTRNLAVILKDVRDELVYALEDLIPTGEDST
jgi:hypothetical protein